MSAMKEFGKLVKARNEHSQAKARLVAVEGEFLKACGWRTSNGAHWASRGHSKADMFAHDAVQISICALLESAL